MPPVMLVKEKKQKNTSRAGGMVFFSVLVFLSLTAYWLDASEYYSFGPKSKTEEFVRQQYTQSIHKYLEANLEDLESYEPLEFGSLKTVTDSTFVAYHKFRNKNSYGQIITNNIKFYINGRGQVYRIDENY